MTISEREFFTTKPVVIEYVTLTLTHVAFGTLRYVKNQYFEKTFASEIYQPAAMEITEANQDDKGMINYEIQLGRIGSMIKPFIKAIDEYPLGWMIPIEAQLNFWLSTDTDNPYRNPVNLSVGNLAVNGDAVAISIDTANPRGQAVARKYNGTDFPGTDAQV